MGSKKKCKIEETAKQVSNVEYMEEYRMKGLNIPNYYLLQQNLTQMLAHFDTVLNKETVDLILLTVKTQRKKQA